MQQTVIRSTSNRKYTYSFLDKSSVHAEVDITLWRIPPAITVIHSLKRKELQLVQRSKILGVLNSLPVINTKTLVPFFVLCDEHRIGRVYTSIFSPLFFFEMGDERYEIRLHSHNYCSVMKNSVQVALFQKYTTTISGQRKYDLYFSDSISLELLLLFCAFCDVTFFRNRNSVYFARRETAVSLFPDKYISRAEWRPR